MTKADYAAYQNAIAQRHLLPLLRRVGAPLDQSVIDVGCGTGGFALALAQELDVDVHGIDVLETDIASAQEAARSAGLVRATFEVVDVLSDRLPKGPYGLMLLRDVVEHLPDATCALLRLRPLLSADGLLYVTFPPWHGPYAGHQHNAKSWVKFMPYAHCLSPTLFLWLLHRLEPARTEWLRDERQICCNRLTRRRFEREAFRTGWHIKYRQTYFLRPAFMRMGLPTLANGFIGRLPIVGEFFTTACEYLLAPAVATRE